MFPDTEYWNTVAADWATHPQQRLWRAYSDRVNMLLLRPWLPDRPVDYLLKTDIFDEAVSPGLMPHLQRFAHHCIAVDIAPVALHAAHLRYPHLHLAAADALLLPFASHSFDLIISTSTLDHLTSHAELTNALRQLHRVLKPGGHLLLTLDNPINPLIALRNHLPFTFLHRLGILPYQVGHTTSLARLIDLLASIGFIIRDSRTHVHCPRVLAIPVANILDRLRLERVSGAFVRFLMGFEAIRRLPTGMMTGHYIAVSVQKPFQSP